MQSTTIGRIHFKGGGYGVHHIPVIGARLTNLRHHWWTGTTDDFPRTDGVGDPNGGLRPKPNWRVRFVRWFKWVIKGGK